MGSDVLLQPSTLQADNHKKRTGFGPQQASFGVYLSNAFGGMSGALTVGFLFMLDDGTMNLPHLANMGSVPDSRPWHSAPQTEKNLD